MFRAPGAGRVVGAVLGRGSAGSGPTAGRWSAPRRGPGSSGGDPFGAISGCMRRQLPPVLGVSPRTAASRSGPGRGGGPSYTASCWTGSVTRVGWTGPAGRGQRARRQRGALTGPTRLFEVEGAGHDLR